MKIGKVSEAILKRSVLQFIQLKDDDRNQSAGIGKNCALFTQCSGRQAALSIQPFCINASGRMEHAVVAALNHVAAGGALPTGVMLSVLMPSDSEEEELKEMMRQAEEVCAQLSVRILGGHTEVTDGVNRPLITAVGVGERSEHACLGVRPCQDVVVSKWIGLEGTSLLAHAYEQKLLGRYPVRLVEEAKNGRKHLSILQEAALAVRFGVGGMHDVRSGGIFGALWEMGEKAGVGLKIDLRKIPVKQETIEICEFVHCNPYELLSGGMLLMITESGEELVSELKKEGISAAVIGSTTDQHEKIIMNEEEVRFLTPFNGDEIDRFMQ